MIIQVVARQVGKNSTHEAESADTLLVYGVRGAFHESVFAAFVGHLRQEFVQRDGVGRGVVGLDGAAVDKVADCGAQATLVAQ